MQKSLSGLAKCVLPLAARTTIRFLGNSSGFRVRMLHLGRSLSYSRTMSTKATDAEVLDSEPSRAEELSHKEAIDELSKDIDDLKGGEVERDGEEEEEIDANVASESTKPGEVREDLKIASRNEKPTGSLKSHNFQTETRQVLDIVTNSLYTDKEVFLRELISNASDALEKARFMKNKGILVDSEEQLEIRIFTDEAAQTITLQDTGIGMTDTELVDLLGTIAKSGSKQWVRENLQGENASDAKSQNIIGQFGVGFYSSFMVGSKIEVYSRSAKLPADGSKPAAGQYWVSDGSGAYEICDADGVTRGTKVIVHLRPESKSFSVEHKVESIIKKYSNFVGFPIYLNGTRLNTIQALWMMEKNEIKDEQHDEFYRYISGAYDTPSYRMQFVTDAPIQIRALFYFPERHMEKFGMGRMEPGVSLYSRKVLIQSKSKVLLPEYFRFVRGVTDSEDIPLNISRENMQDSLLISRMSSVLTKKIIKFLVDEAKRDHDAYLKWYAEFGNFLKEGVCSDFTHKGDLARLLRYESSVEKPDKLISLDAYISRMPPSQHSIYYLIAPNRALAEESPYYEGMKARGTEVLFMYNGMDDFVMQSLREFNKRKIVSAESGHADASKETSKEREAKEKEHDSIISFVKSVLGTRVAAVTLTARLSTHPAIVVDHESASLRKMLRMVDNSMYNQTVALSKQKLEINPDHPIMKKLLLIKDVHPELAKNVVEQVFDNALLAADILDNPRSILPRLNVLIEAALGGPQQVKSV